LSSGDHRGAVDQDADRPQGTAGVDDGRPGRHEVVDDQDRGPRTGHPQAGGTDRVSFELPRGRQRPLGGRQPGGVRPPACGAQRRDDTGGHARPA